MSDSRTRPAELDRSEEIRVVIETLVSRRSRGEVVADEAVLSAHPQLLPELASELRKLALIARARDQLPISSDRDDPSTAETRFFSENAQVRASRSLEIRCPLCHEPLEI